MVKFKHIDTLKDREIGNMQVIKQDIVYNIHNSGNLLQNICISFEL